MEEQWFVSNLLRGVLLLLAAYWGLRRDGTTAAWLIAGGIGVALVASESLLLLSSGSASPVPLGEVLEYAVFLVPLAVVVAFVASVRAAQILAAERIGPEPEPDNPHATVIRRRFAFAGAWLLLCAPPALPFLGMLTRWYGHPPTPKYGGDLGISVAIFGALITSVLAAVPAILSVVLAAVRVWLRPSLWVRPWVFARMRGGSLAVGVAAVVAATGLILSLSLAPLMMDEARKWAIAMQHRDP